MRRFDAVTTGLWSIDGGEFGGKLVDTYDGVAGCEADEKGRWR
jgi:hypothetical protein